MLRLNDEKWSDLKNDLLEPTGYEIEEELLYHYDEHSGSEIEAGRREVYYFEKNGMEIRMQVDIKPRMEKVETEKADGSLKVSYNEVEGENMYNITIQLKDDYGDWIDSSALEENL